MEYSQTSTHNLFPCWSSRGHTRRRWYLDMDPGGLRIHPTPPFPSFKNIESKPRSAHFSGDVKTLVAALDDGIHMFTIENVGSFLTLTQRIPYPVPGPASAVSYNGQNFLRCAGNQDIYIWRAGSGCWRRQYKGGEGNYVAVHFSPTGNTCVTLRENRAG